MASSEKDDIPMLTMGYPSSFNEHEDSRFRTFGYQGRSASMSTTSFSVDTNERGNSFRGHTGPLRGDRRTAHLQMSGPLYVNRASDRRVQPTENETVVNVAGTVTAEKFGSFNGTKYKDRQDEGYAKNNEHLYKSGQLGLCNDPYCTSCPTYYKVQGAQRKNSNDPKFHSTLYGDAKGWAKISFSFINRCIPGVMNPHAKIIQQWNKIFVISSLIAIFVDPLFFFLLSVQGDNKCIVINWPVTTAIVVLRSITDFVHLLHILLQLGLLMFLLNQE